MTKQYNAKETSDHYGSMTGKYSLTTNFDDSVTYQAGWSVDYLDMYFGGLGIVTDYSGTIKVSLDDSYTEDFVLAQNGSDQYDSYSYHAKESYSGHSAENLAAELWLDEWTFEELLWYGSSWELSQSHADSKQDITVSHTKTRTNDNASESVGGIQFTGTAADSNEYSFEKSLSKTSDYRDGSKTTVGTRSEHTNLSNLHSFKGADQFYVFNGGTGKRQGSSESYSLSATDLDYDWDATQNQWRITGNGTATDGFAYQWSDSASGSQSGNMSETSSSSHQESLTTAWVYADNQWTIDSIKGKGEGNYNNRYHWDSEASYSRAFYETTVEGTEKSTLDRTRDENWNVSFVLVNGKIVRESNGTIDEIYHESSEYQGSGSLSSSTITEKPATMNRGYAYPTYSIYHYGSYYEVVYEGTQINTAEREYSLTESGSQSYHEEVNTVWSSRANAQGQLVYTAFAKAEMTANSEGSYDYSRYDYDSSEFLGSASDYEDCGYYSHSHEGSLNTFSDSKHITNVSESFNSSQHEQREARTGVNNGSFSLVSLTGTGSAAGNSLSTSRSYSDQSNSIEWEYDAEESGICRFDENVRSNSYGDSSYESLSQASYQASVHWGASSNHDFSPSITNHLYGIGNTVRKSGSDGSGEYQWLCTTCGEYDGTEWSSEGSSEELYHDFGYDNTVSYVGWGQGKASTPAVRYSGFSYSTISTGKFGNRLYPNSLKHWH